MTKSFATATALASVLVALTSAAGAGPVQLAQMNVAPKIQPAPPPNLARTPVITPKIDARRLSEEKDKAEKDTAANPEQVPQETATGAEAPEIARQGPPPAATRVTRAPLPLARPKLFEGLDPAGLIDARGAAEAREAAEAAAVAGVEVEQADLGGLGDPLQGDKGGDPGPQLGGMSPDEFKERFGLGGMKSPEDIAAGMATEFNDLGNRGTSSPAGDFSAGFRPDPSSIPKGDLASDKTSHDGYVSEQEEWFYADSGDEFTAYLVTTKERADGSGVEIVRSFLRTEEQVIVTEYDATGTIVDSVFITRRGQDGTSERNAGGSGVVGNQFTPFRDNLNRLQTPESAPSAGGGCAPNDGSAACQEFRRLMREGNSPGRIMAGATRVNPGDPDDGATGDGPRIRMSEEDLLGNPDPHSLGRGGAGSGQGINDGKHINVEGGGTGAGQ